MSRLKIIGAFISAALFALGAWSPAQTSPRPQASSRQPAQPAEGVARGKYIVEGLSRCGQCHTPRDSDGNPERSHWLEGAPVWLKSASPVSDWPLQAPRIAGTPPGTDEELVTLLTTGVWRDGKFLRPPMPQFRMTRQDAEAVVAYLKSVQSAPQ